MSKTKNIIYTGAFLLICLTPLAGMAIQRGESASSENRTLSELPALKNEDGSFNVNILQDLGTYFEDHFAFRQELVTANAKVNSGLFGVSSEDRVIDGTDGWLYYADSLNDYQGTELLSDRAVYGVARSMAITQRNLKMQGINFLYTVAPNKNTLYPEHMPYYMSGKVSDDTNLTRLEGYLEEEKVNYLSLKEVLSETDETLYHKTDSHWTNRGASIAADAILTEVGKEHVAFEEGEGSVRTDFTGDLEGMLFPLASEAEDEYYYDRDFTYSYDAEIESTFDPVISATGTDKENSLIMYRDSFGNALLPFIAEEYGTSYFNRGEPYALTQHIAERQADTVIVERAERFMPETAQRPPVLTGIALDPIDEEEQQIIVKAFAAAADGGADAEQRAEMLIRAEGANIACITGTVDASLLDIRSRIYVQVGAGNLYEAYPMAVSDEQTGEMKDNSWVLYLNPASLLEGLVVSEDANEGMKITLTVYIGEGDSLQIAGRQDVDAAEVSGMVAEAAQVLLAGNTAGSDGIESNIETSVPEEEIAG